MKDIEVVREFVLEPLPRHWFLNTILLAELLVQSIRLSRRCVILRSEGIVMVRHEVQEVVCLIHHLDWAIVIVVRLA